MSAGQMPAGQMPAAEDAAGAGAAPGARGHGLRAPGMRDVGPEEMARFRRVERVFLEVSARRGYREIRTPTLEPLHLFTAAGALSPQLLDRVYSFLDWDGWSGERVVLRPDGTVPAVRWYEEQRAAQSGPARLCYVQPVFRFAPGDAARELWQCGIELLGLPAPEGDAELLLLARELLLALGLDDLRYELAHPGLVRAALGAAGLEAAAQAATYDRLLDGDRTVTEELAVRFPAVASALRLLFGVDGDAVGYLANLRAALLPLAPAAAAPIAELEAAARALDAAGCPYALRPGTARNFEYYTGVTFSLSAAGEPCVSGGRYDGLGEALAGRAAPASGFGADLLRLAELAVGLPS
ncbi:MAG: ATP phosphoribosyltransferase regulatory subunit [Dehalococcoidia bacterium]|nr:ATP phosphoribosyltransferase regulatory subunit [Dehalococcoidia bacterium]